MESEGILYLHGFASGPSSSKAARIVPKLRAAGYHVAFPDQNEGDFEHLTISRAVALAKRHLRERTVIVGSSLGGYVGALVANTDDRVKGLVLMAPAFDLARRLEARNGPEGIADWRAEGRVEVDHYSWGRKEFIGFGFYQDALGHAAFPTVRVPTFVLQGRRDDVVPLKTVEEWVRGAENSVELDVVDDDHTLASSAPRALEAALEMIDRLGLVPTKQAED